MLGRPRRSSTDRTNTIGRIAPDREYNARGNNGGFAALGALLRRVAGVSRLYWCNSPRLVAVRSRFGAVRRPHRRPPRRQTPTTGRCERGACVVDTTMPGRASAHTPGMWRHSCPHDETTTFNVDCHPPAHRKVSTQPTRYVLQPVKSGWHSAQRPRATRRRRRGKAYRPESFTDEVSVERSMGRAKHTIARSLCAHESFVGIIHVMSRVDVR